MKKIICILLILVMAFTAVSCKKPTPATDPYKDMSATDLVKSADAQVEADNEYRITTSTEMTLDYNDVPEPYTMVANNKITFESKGLSLSDLKSGNYDNGNFRVVHEETVKEGDAVISQSTTTIIRLNGNYYFDLATTDGTDSGKFKISSSATDRFNGDYFYTHLYLAMPLEIFEWDKAFEKYTKTATEDGYTVDFINKLYGDGVPSLLKILVSSANTEGEESEDTAAEIEKMLDHIFFTSASRKYSKDGKPLSGNYTLDITEGYDAGLTSGNASFSFTTEIDAQIADITLPANESEYKQR